MKPFVPAFFASIGALVVACSTTTEPVVEDVGGACDAIGICHGKPGQTAKECHDLAHDGNDTACAARKSECIAACPPGDGGEDAHHETDAAIADASTDAAPSAECTAYCGCMEGTCKGKPKYPFTGASDCLAKCGAFEPAEVRCWSSFCSKAALADGGGHDCDHASGTLGLAECE